MCGKEPFCGKLIDQLTNYFLCVYHLKYLDDVEFMEKLRKKRAELLALHSKIQVRVPISFNLLVVVCLKFLCGSLVFVSPKIY